MSCKRRDTWQRWKKEYLVWKCALEVGCYLESLCDSMCPKTATHNISTAAGWGDRWRKASSLFLLWNRNAFTDTKSRHSDGADKQTQNNQPQLSAAFWTCLCGLQCQNRGRGPLEVCLPRSWLSVISVLCLMLYKTSDFKIKEKQEIHGSHLHPFSWLWNVSYFKV